MYAAWMFRAQAVTNVVLQGIMEFLLRFGSFCLSLIIYAVLLCILSMFCLMDF